jgi:hypothetical protein
VTVMLDSFFGVHPAVIRSGLWKRMRSGERDLYLFLMERSEGLRTRQLKFVDAEVRKAMGTAPRTLCDARKRLQEYGLVLCERKDGNKYLYTICNPITGVPYPGGPKDKPPKYDGQGLILMLDRLSPYLKTKHQSQSPQLVGNAEHGVELEFA